MANQQEGVPRVTTGLPKQLDSAGAKLVYLYVTSAEGATLDELQAALDLQKLTLYSLLQTLTTHGLIDQTGATYVCHRQPLRGETQ